MSAVFTPFRSNCQMLAIFFWTWISKDYTQVQKNKKNVAVLILRAYLGCPASTFSSLLSFGFFFLFELHHFSFDQSDQCVTTTLKLLQLWTKSIKTTAKFCSPKHWSGFHRVPTEIQQRLAPSIAVRYDWLSKPMLIIQPIRMNIKPNRDLLTCVFPRFAFPALIGSTDSLCVLWLAREVPLVLILRHAIETHLCCPGF